MSALAVLDIDEEQETGKEQPPGYGSLGPLQFRTFLEECRYQPTWRNMADKCADYHDGNQLDGETLEAMERKGMGPIQRNIIQPLINVVLGMEAKTRTDWRVSADAEQLQDVAEGLSSKLHEAERETRADRACSDGYGAQIKAGLGWVEVSRASDPFEYPYRAQYVHRREIWWDWRDESHDLAKARFLMRKRWFDVDQAIAYFPEDAGLLRACLGDPNQYEMLVAKRALDLGQTLEESRGLDIEDYEQWRSFSRRRLCLYETWYRVFCRGWVARLPNSEVIEVDPKNVMHLALLNRGVIRPERAVYSKLRSSIWAGPHKLVDCACPKRTLPYVPFWGYREDRTGAPYGLVRAMLSPQDEVNARLQKMMWLLGAKRVIMDSDALDTEQQSPQDMLDEISRPDAVVFLNPSRTNRQTGFNVDENLTLADAQFKVLQDAMQSAQQVVGVFNAMLGRESSAASGLAINSLVEQGTTALADINDNYRFARRLVGERLLDLIRDDLIGQQVEVMHGESGNKRMISLNTPVQVQDPETQQVATIIKNDVRAAKVRVSLDDVPSSSAYREQQFTMLAELTKGLPPQLQGVIAPFIMEASDLRKRREIAETLRKALGQPTPKTPEEEQQAEEALKEANAFAQQIAQKQALLELQEREAKVEQLRAQAAKAMAEAQKVGTGDGGAGNLRHEFEMRVRDVEAKARGEIDRVSAQLLTVKMNAATREQRLIAQLSQAVTQIKANKASADTERRRGEIEREIAKIEAERDKEVAHIEADAESVMAGVHDEMMKLREEMRAQIEKAEAATAKLAVKMERVAAKASRPIPRKPAK